MGRSAPNAGVRIGDQLNVERWIRRSRTPDTGQVVRRIASQLGLLKVMDVDDRSSACSVVSGSGFQCWRRNENDYAVDTLASPN